MSAVLSTKLSRPCPCPWSPLTSHLLLFGVLVDCIAGLPCSRNQCTHHCGHSPVRGVLGSAACGVLLSGRRRRQQQQHRQAQEKGGTVCGAGQHHPAPSAVCAGCGRAGQQQGAGPVATAWPGGPCGVGDGEGGGVGELFSTLMCRTHCQHQCIATFQAGVCWSSRPGRTTRQTPKWHSACSYMGQPTVGCVPLRRGRPRHAWCSCCAASCLRLSPPPPASCAHTCLSSSSCCCTGAAQTQV